MPPLKIFQGPVVLDTSVIFNLLGCKSPVEVIQALGVKCLIEERTMNEVKYHPIPGFCHKEAIEGMLASSSLEIHRMSENEYDLYLSLVTGKPAESLDIGESAAIAVAISQRYEVILDDGKARKIFSNRFSSAPYSSSLNLFLIAAHKAGWSDKDIWSLISESKNNARMNIVKGEEAIFEELRNSAFMAKAVV